MSDLVEFVNERLNGFRPQLAIVLGSGFAGVVETFDASQEIPYSHLPQVPSAQIEGHKGRLVVGNLRGVNVLAFQGRHHLYQGFSVSEIVWQVQLAHSLGACDLLLTNAAGGVNEGYKPGDFMWISDHLNMTGVNPLCGIQPAPFLDVTRLYRTDCLSSLQKRLQQTGACLHEGVLCGLTGPSYETAAEVRMIQRFGADAVSMSTVNEAIYAHFLGMRVAAVSLISNRAAGLSGQPLNHAEVLDVGRSAAPVFTDLLDAYITTLSP